jgi:hypothetical protein
MEAEGIAEICKNVFSIVTFVLIPEEADRSLL